jgi:hypothetical protein
MNNYKPMALAFALLWGLSVPGRGAEEDALPLPTVADWSFIQSVGGLQVGQALQQSVQHTWRVPLYCDLSGKQTFTQTPTLVNSGMIIKKTIAKQEGHNIFISLQVEKPVWTSNPSRAQCGVILLESSAGVHEVLYKDATGKSVHVGFVEFKMDTPSH